jgi:release factor glutamine methyltransferase
VFFGGFVFEVWGDVYEPAEDSFLFAENLSVADGSCVLDVGCGCGILGVVAAASARWVIGVDVNPFAVQCAKRNALLNGVADRVGFVRGDLFGAFRVERVFDCVLFNAPYLPSERIEGESWVERGWCGGRGGREVIDRFVDDVPRFVRRGGCVLLMQSSLAGVDETVRRFEGKGLRVSVVAECDLPFFERLVLLRACKG